jgi:stage V sporulation protein G
MELTEVQIHLCQNMGRLRAFCCLTFEQSFVVRDVKIIEGDTGLFLAMPSRKLTDHCSRCHEKNHLKARYCNHCGLRLNENRASQPAARTKLHADVAHPINTGLRDRIEAAVIRAFHDEVTQSQQPGYAPRKLMDYESPGAHAW